jgi:hypothetical protein
MLPLDESQLLSDITQHWLNSQHYLQGHPVDHGGLSQLISSITSHDTALHWVAETWLHPATLCSQHQEAANILARVASIVPLHCFSDTATFTIHLVVSLAMSASPGFRPMLEVNNLFQCVVRRVALPQIVDNVYSVEGTLPNLFRLFSTIFHKEPSPLTPVNFHFLIPTGVATSTLTTFFCSILGGNLFQCSVDDHFTFQISLTDFLRLGQGHLVWPSALPISTPEGIHAFLRSILSLIRSSSAVCLSPWFQPFRQI